METPVVRPRRENRLWLTEEQTDNMSLSLRVHETLFRKTTPYQELLIVDTPEYGRAMVLDGAIQLTERDEFCYSEMMAHVPICSHPDPRRVLIVGGGDGAILREVLRHPEVEVCTLIDIDEEVIRASKKYLPTVGCALEDPRATSPKPHDFLRSGPKISRFCSTRSRSPACRKRKQREKPLLTSPKPRATSRKSSKTA